MTTQYLNNALESIFLTPSLRNNSITWSVIFSKNKYFVDKQENSIWYNWYMKPVLNFSKENVREKNRKEQRINVVMYVSSIIGICLTYR